MPLSQPPRILVFDSGVGGTTILSAISDQLPTAQFTYLADNAWLPYGSKTSTQISHRLGQLFEAIDIDNCADIVVIACNSASTTALNTLREKFSVPIVGVVPAIKPAAKITESNCIVLLATAQTIQGEYVQELSNEFAANKVVIKVATPELVALAENKILGGIQTIPNDLHGTINNIKAAVNQGTTKTPDTFILGCTHFPALKQELEKAWGHPAHWIDSSQAIARRVADLLDMPTQKPPHSTSTQCDIKIVLTKDDARFNRLFSISDTLKIRSVSVIENVN